MAATEHTDEDLLGAARAGDRDALEALLLRYQAKVYGFGMKMCRDPEDAKDILQDTLLAMARTVNDFRGASSLSTWLYSIARSFCIKKRRRGRSVVTEPLSASPSGDTDAANVVHPGPGPEEDLGNREIEAALAQAIAGLAPMYREVLVLRDIEGLTAPAVAEVLGLSIQAVKSRLHRARLAVRQSLAPLLGFAPAKPVRAISHKCPDVLLRFSRHLEGEISAELCAEMERHVAGCDNCRAACESLRRTLNLCRTAPSPQVPEAVQQSVRRSLRALLAARS
jgi:RNA polymerase sigma-70 factor (ECF subfamily)